MGVSAGIQNSVPMINYLTAGNNGVARVWDWQNNTTTPVQIYTHVLVDMATLFMPHIILWEIKLL